MAQRQYYFGTGSLFVLQAVGAPILFGALQDVSVDFAAERKSLHGQNSFPLDTARGKATIEGKATNGQLSPQLYNALFFGQTITTGMKLLIVGEQGTIPTTPFQITVANGATFSKDLGVMLNATGVWMTRVASGPTTGQYSVNETTGVYTFATADVAKTVSINYLHTSVAGFTIAGANLAMGDIPTFGLILSNKFKGKTSTLELLTCTSSKLSFPAKQDDYALPDFDFAAQDDGTGQVFRWGMTGD